MNKQELVASVAAKTGFTKKDAETAVNGFIASVEGALTSGDKVQLIGFGTFEVKKSKRELQEKEEIRVTQKKPLRFRHPRRRYSRLERH